MPDLRVRLYNVLFGDAILVSVPDRDENGAPVVRHMMVDFGNSLAGAAGRNDVFEPILRDILEQTGGDPLDLYVMSHEHLDHIQGPLAASNRFDLELQAHDVWMPRSAHPTYYDDFPNAREKHLAALELYDRISAFVGADAGHPTLNTMMLNNNPNRSKDCVDKIRTIKADGSEPTYVHRELDPNQHHRFRDVRFDIWAPEEDTSIYYGRFKRLSLGVEGGEAQAGDVGGGITPPPGVDAGVFFDLVRMRRTGLIENLFTIDKAANNSSLVFTMEWRGWKLLFTGDAEERSWKEMNARDLLEPVHFLKISHHGSHNGTPNDNLLEKVLPSNSHDGRARKAAVSTHPDGYPGAIPDEPTLAAVEARVDELFDTSRAAAGSCVDVEFPG